MKGHFEKTTVNQGEKLTYWRSIDRRIRTEEYLASIENEFADDMREISSMDRRSMLKVMGATIALAGIGVSCRRPEEKILPYVKQPADITPGIPNFFATAQPLPFGANGILVESHEGRPTKVEGNPEHPESLGKASFINQAAALELYDPDRSRFCVREQSGVRSPAEWSSWDSFRAEHFFELKKKNGHGLAFLCDSDVSPTFLRLKNLVKDTYPEAKFFVHEPMRQRNVENASAMAFGPHMRVRYHFDNAKVIASLFADPFSYGPEHLRHMRGYGKNREVLSPADVSKMSRLYAIEADFSLAGTNADHRLRLPIGQAVSFLRALAYELHATFNLDVDLSIANAKSLSALVSRPPSYKHLDRKFITVLAKDLAYRKGEALIIGGYHLPKEALALIHVLNVALRGFNKTFEVMNVDDQDVVAHLTLPDVKELADELGKGRVESLIFLNTNPVYTAPRDLKFASLIKKAKTSIHLGQNVDETAALCTWHVPSTHFLEHFADARAYDGHISLVQPLINPLHNARSILEFLAAILGLNKKPLELVKDSFHARFLADIGDKKFNRALHDGVIANSSFSKVSRLNLNCALVYGQFDALKPRAPSKDSVELVLGFDRRVLDGRFANHSWLTELADPVTKLNWGNALLMSPKLAKELRIKSGLEKNVYMAELVKLTVDNKNVVLPVFVMPGLADYAVVTSLGYGRTKAGEVGTGVGVDVYDLVSDFETLSYHGVKLEPLKKMARISSTQEQFAMNGDVVQQVDTLTMRSRDPARVTKVANYVKNPLSAKRAGIPEKLLTDEPLKKEKVPLQITDAWNYTTGNQWGMVIDLAKCTGCNACVTACQSENNIPVVGMEQVIRGRNMQWIRVDRYLVGDVNDPQAISQPVLCQHCENAPCEPVCPVAATSHDDEGLNAMTYNRCVGTRYCANNCPYKVRRFNYFDFSHSGNIHVDKHIVERQKTIKLQRNPDVTVRYRGVMEKCTYCTQRIQEAKMKAAREGRDPKNLRDGDVTPACAQTCPSDAIVFGNINDETSRVSALRSVDRNYTMLDILNTRPRTSYLSMLRNPHPDLVA